MVSTIQPISTKRTITSYLKSLNIWRLESRLGTCTNMWRVNTLMGSQPSALDNCIFNIMAIQI